MSQQSGITGNMWPKGAVDPMQVYNPGRDLANCGGGLLKLTVRTLRPGQRPAWYDRAMAELEVDDMQLAVAALALTKGLHLYAADPDCPDVGVGLERSGYFDAALGAQLLLMARFGQLCAALMTDGIRSVTYDGVAPPQLLHVEAAVKLAEDRLEYVEPRVARRGVGSWLKKLLRVAD